MKCPKCNIAGFVTETGATSTGFTRICHICDNRWFVTMDDLRNEKHHLTPLALDGAIAPDNQQVLPADVLVGEDVLPEPPRQ